MASMLKTFGIGLLCTVLSPLILLVLVLYFIYTLLGIIVMFFIHVYRYFSKGGSVLDELAIEKKAKQILVAQEEYNQKMRDAALNSANQQINPTINSNYDEDTKFKSSDFNEYNIENFSPNDQYGGEL